MIAMNRRGVMRGMAAAPMLWLPAAATAPAFSLDTVRALARARAGAPYRAAVPVPGAAAIDFDRAGRIAFDPARTLFPGGARIRLFPPTRTAPVPVAINIVEGGAARPLKVDGGWFTGPDVPPGASGFRAVTPSGTSDWLAFQGASYFRAAGSQDQYGLSARAVVVEPVIGDAEEFPAFTEFWLEQGPGGTLVTYALLDGPSLTGAFRFVSRIGSAGVAQEVTATLFLRRDIARLGLAPATSMYWYGQNDRHAATDWRPEVHDSDGLLIAGGDGGRIWRPLDNPRRAILNSFAESDPAGYGLLQRDRAFDHYQDDGAFYERRPNLWIAPKDRWGKGAVALYAYPTRSETEDNVVAYWTPAAPARKGARLDYAYALMWSSNEPATPLARAVDHWSGAGGIPGAPPVAGIVKIVADFAGPGLAGLTRTSGVTATATLDRGRLVSAVAYPVARTDARFRAMIEVATTSGADPANLRVMLSRGGRPLSETMVTQIWP